MKKQTISGLIGILLVLLLVAMPVALAKVAPNKGSDVSAKKAADAGKENANANAAFNRGELFTCPVGDGWASSENYCLYTWFGWGIIV